MHEKGKEAWMKYCLEKLITNCDKGLIQIVTSFITNRNDRYSKLRQVYQIATAQRRMFNFFRQAAFNIISYGL